MPDSILNNSITLKPNSIKKSMTLNITDDLFRIVIQLNFKIHFLPQFLRINAHLINPKPYLNLLFSSIYTSKVNVNG